jgi:transposase-like protein
MTRSYEEQGFRSNNIWTICTCPKCGREHKVRLFWSGKTKPKIFCQDCKVEFGIDGLVDIDEHKVGRNILSNLNL